MNILNSQGIVLARSPRLLEAEVETLVATLRDRHPSYDTAVAIQADTLQHLLQAYFGHDLVFNILETGEIDDIFVAEQPIRVQNVVAEIKRQAMERGDLPATTPTTQGTA